MVVFLSGPEPPRFLLDAVHHGTDGRVAAGLLFAHVAVSYAINQNVLARTLERYLGHTLSRKGWALMTAALTLSSLLIAILVPVFSDLVQSSAALTSRRPPRHSRCRRSIRSRLARRRARYAALRGHWPRPIHGRPHDAGRRSWRNLSVRITREGLGGAGAERARRARILLCRFGGRRFHLVDRAGH